MKLSRAAWLMVIAGSQLGAPLAQAQDAKTDEVMQQLQRRIEELEHKVHMLEREKGTLVQTNDGQSPKRIQELDQKVKVLERERELEKERAVETGKALPTVSLGLNGLIIRSANTNFLMNVHGYVQADGRFYLNEHNPANDTFLLRRVRPIIEGTVFDRFDYRFMPDFGFGNGSSSSAANNALLDDA